MWPQKLSCEKAQLKSRRYEEHLVFCESSPCGLAALRDVPSQPHPARYPRFAFWKNIGHQNVTVSTSVPEPEHQYSNHSESEHAHQELPTTNHHGYQRNTEAAIG